MNERVGWEVPSTSYLGKNIYLRILKVVDEVTSDREEP